MPVPLLSARRGLAPRFVPRISLTSRPQPAIQAPMSWPGNRQILIGGSKSEGDTGRDAASGPF
jgi:hypothetical protein